MNDIKMTNVPSLSVDKAVDELASVYCSFIESNKIGRASCRERV